MSMDLFLIQCGFLIRLIEQILIKAELYLREASLIILIYLILVQLEVKMLAGMFMQMIVLEIFLVMVLRHFTYTIPLD